MAELSGRIKNADYRLMANRSGRYLNESTKQQNELGLHLAITGASWIGSFYRLSSATSTWEYETFGIRNLSRYAT